MFLVVLLLKHGIHKYVLLQILFTRELRRDIYLIPGSTSIHEQPATKQASHSLDHNTGRGKVQFRVVTKIFVVFG